MEAITFIEQAESAGFTLAATGEKLVVTPASKLTDPQRQYIRAHKPEIIAALIGRAREPERVEITVTDFALSTGQRVEFKATVPADRLPDLQRAAIKFTLSDSHGDPSRAGGGYAIGVDGDTHESLGAELRARYGERLVSMEASA